jgi:hypothetical protein
MSSSMLPIVINSALPGCIRAGGLESNRRPTALRATTLRSSAPSGTTSNRTTGTPALAKCPAIPDPIVPAPITTALAILSITHSRPEIGFPRTPQGARPAGLCPDRPGEKRREPQRRRLLQGIDQHRTHMEL